MAPFPLGMGLFLYKEKNKMIHELKIWPEYFKEVFNGNKTFEIRKNDRDYKIGDWLKLMEYKPNKGYTGNEIFRKITYITDYAQKDNYIVMAIKGV
jgi:hypothetical protein